MRGQAFARKRTGNRGVINLLKRVAVHRAAAGAFARGRATQMPSRINAPPRPWIGPSASLSTSQPSAAAPTASRKITSEENVAGNLPSATAKQALSEHLRDQREREKRQPAVHRTRHEIRLEQHRDDEHAGAGDRRRHERERADADFRPRPCVTDREDVEPEEDRRDQRIAVTDKPLRREAVALADECRAADQTECEPKKITPGDSFAEDDPCPECDPDRRHGRNESCVGNGRGENREMPEKRSPAKKRPESTTARSVENMARVSLGSVSAQSARKGSANAQRQNALAKGPTSARRTKIGEAPIAKAPTTRAANATADSRAGRVVAFTECFILLSAS
jgi:hypothetical protein